MNPLLQKDLRENFKVAVVGLIVFTLILIAAYEGCLSNLNSLVFNGNGQNVSTLHPLFSDRTVMLATFFCAIYGALLGWLQARNEAHRDLWAFLIHRPITRTQIFQGKAFAGVILYCLGAGLPLLVLMLVVTAPGHIPMPFEWPMTLPLAAIFLTGFAYYFAGMLTGLRQARWFGSRWFGIGLAIFASILAFLVDEFWQSFLATAIATLVLALAAWGAYQSGGYFRGQPRPAQAALSLSMAAGSGILLIVVLGLFSALVLQRLSTRYSFTRQYIMLNSGNICTATWRDGEWVSVKDLAGHPFLNPKTGQPFARGELDGQRASSSSASANQKDANAYYNNYRKTYRFFTLWNLQDKKLWYVDRSGRLVGFDGITGKMINVLHAHDADPAGFMRPAFGYGPDYFWHNQGGNSPVTLATRQAVYRVDLRDPSVNRIFTADTNDEITGYCGLHDTYNDENQITLATRHTVQLLNANGGSLFKTAYAASSSDYPSVTIYYLLNGEQALWFNPDDMLIPAHVVWPARAGQTNQSIDLPSLFEPYHQDLSDRILTSLCPPGVLLSTVLIHDLRRHAFSFTPLNLKLLSGYGWSAACVLISLGMLSRHHFSARTKAIWSIFIFLLGIPGLVALLVAEEWPVREVCPKCQRLRAVDREHCEYCEAEFPAPERNGTEIFEPLSASQK